MLITFCPHQYKGFLGTHISFYFIHSLPIECKKHITKFNLVSLHESFKVFLPLFFVKLLMPMWFSDGGDLLPVLRQDSRDSLTSEHEKKRVDQEEWLSQVHTL